MKTKYDRIIATEYNGIDGWTGLDYVVISEPVEVDFPELSHEIVVKNQIAVIDQKINTIQAEAEASITQLKARKQELLAITHEGE